MNNSQPILCSMSMVNLNGITARTLSLVELEELMAQQFLSSYGNTVSLLGENGVGKTTILGGYQLSLVADLRYVSLGTSDKFKKVQKLVDSEMFHRLGNPSTVALEVQTRNNGERHLYVIHAAKPSGNNVTLTHMRLVLPGGVKPMTCLAKQENNSWIPFSPHIIRDTAVSLGCGLITYDTAEAYLLDLFNDGVLPKPLQKERDKANFAQVFHSAMSGRLDESIERNLSNYLLSHTRGNIKGVVDILQNSMQVVRQTRMELQQNGKDYSFFKELLDNAINASSFAWAVAEKQLQLTDSRLQGAQTKRVKANLELTKARADVEKLEAKVEQLRVERDLYEDKRQKAEKQLLLATQAATEYARCVRYKQDRETRAPEVRKAKREHKEAQIKFNKVSEQFNQASKELAETQEQLADAVKAFETTHERAGKYDHACRQLKTVENFYGQIDTDNLIGPIDNLKNEKSTCGSELNSLERQCQQMDQIRDAYQIFSKKLARLGEQVAPEDLQGWVSKKRQHLSQLQTLVNSLPYEKEKLAGLERDNEKQRKYQGLLNTAGLKSVPDSVEAFFQTVALYKQKVEDAGESVAKAKAEFEELTEHHHILKIALVKLENRHQSWAQLQPQVRSLLDAFPERTDWTQNGCHELQRELYANRTILNEQIAELQAKNIQDNEYLDKLRNRDTDSLELLRALAEEINGLPVADLFDDIDPADARYMEAALGSLINGILVDDPQTAARDLLSSYGEDWPLDDLLLIPSGKSIEEWRVGHFDQDALFEDLTAQFVGDDDSAEAPWCILSSGEGLRISQLRENPVLGDKARTDLIKNLEAAIETNENTRKTAEEGLSIVNDNIDALRLVLPQAELAFSCEPDLEAAKGNKQQAARKAANAKAELESQETQAKQLSSSLDKLSQCEPFVPLLYRDIVSEISICESTIRCSENAKRETEHFEPLFKHFDSEWALLMQPYPTDPNALKQRVSEKSTHYDVLSERLRDMEALHEVRFYLGPTYAQAKAMLGKTSNKQQALQEQAKQLSEQAKTLNNEKQAAEQMRDEAQKHAIESTVALEQLENELGHTEAVLKEIAIDYRPGMEKQLKDEKEQLEAAFKAARDRADECGKQLSQANAEQQKKLDLANECINQESLAQSAQEKSNAIRNDVQSVIANDGVGAVLQGAMTNALEAIDETDTAFQQVRTLISKVNGCAQNYGIPVTDPMLEFGQKLTGTDIIEVVHLYAEAVKLFKRRARHDLIHSGDPQQMLIELDEACRMAQKALDNAEAMFQTKRGELGEAIAKRVIDEQRAVRKLSKQLHGIGFGQVAEVRLVTEYVPKFDKVLDALRQGSQVMDDLFAEADSIEDALSDLYHRTTAGQIKGEKLLDHRNYLVVKTQIRRRGRNDFEDLEGTHLSTGERLGSGLVVLISIIKHWAGAAHGKKPFAIPLVMDEVSRLDAQSQATVAELCRRCGVQLLMAAPESLGKITGLGYQLVRVWPEGTDLGNPNKADEARSWVQITGLQDSTELTVNSDSVLSSILGD